MGDLGNKKQGFVYHLRRLGQRRASSFITGYSSLRRQERDGRLVEGCPASNRAEPSEQYGVE